ncbi:MAG: hypothetical protein DI539_28230 [Flavobacterium psychrophilum]|nr:MAG: hypothetical protein DI539_28230 [Flavobacterium psychrophilum]
MTENGSINRKKRGTYLMIGYFASQRIRSGVSKVVYNNPMGSRKPFRKKYRMTIGKYLFMVID